MNKILAIIAVAGAWIFFGSMLVGFATNDETGVAAAGLKVGFLIVTAAALVAITRLIVWKETQ